jgi:hypothetical protein
MAHYDGKVFFAASDFEESGVDDNFAAGHAPGIYLVVLNQVEFPLIAFDKVVEIVFLTVPFDGVLDAGTDIADHLCFLMVGAELAFGEKLLVIGKAERMHHGRRDKAKLFSAGDGHARTC